MSHAAAITALKKYTKVAAHELPQSDLIEALQDESDRGAIILAVTIVDDALAAKLKRRMSHLEPKEMQAMFDVENGLLNTFANRIKIAQAFEMITRGERFLLDLLKTMRNSAAHARRITDFNTKVIRDAMLSIFPDVEDDDDPRKWPDHQMRDIFCLMCGTFADTFGEESLIDPETGNLNTMSAVQSARFAARVKPSQPSLLATLLEQSSQDHLPSDQKGKEP